MWTATFWKDAAERAVKTAAQVFVTMLIAAGTDLFTTDWKAALAAAGMAALLSLVTSVGSGFVNPTGTASLVTLPSTGAHAPLEPRR
jgi:hypothetical protein